MSINDGLLSELKLQYSMELDNKKTLESKANNIITIGGTVATLLFGFAAFLANRSDEILYVSYIMIMLTIAISTCVAAIVISIYASRVQKYRFALVHSLFYEQDRMKEDVFQEYYGKPKNDFEQIISKGYLRSIKTNSELNELKAKYVSTAQIVFFSGMLIIPVLLIVLIAGVGID